MQSAAANTHTYPSSLCKCIHQLVKREWLAGRESQGVDGSIFSRERLALLRAVSPAQLTGGGTSLPREENVFLQEAFLLGRMKQPLGPRPKRILFRMQFKLNLAAI